MQLWSLSVDEETMYLHLTMTVSATWKDERLKCPEEQGINRSITLSKATIASIWTPELYLVNEQESLRETMLAPQKIFMKNCSNILTYSLRYSAKVMCILQYYYFPMDTQHCIIQLQSLQDPADEVILIWERPLPTQFPTKKTPPQFEISEEDISAEECTDDQQNGIKMSCVRLVVKMHRLNGFHFMQLFIPSILTVVVSWIGLWISVEAVPARVSLGITSLLTLVTQFSRAQNGLPPVSYVKAIDVWMMGCLVMVFCSMLEFAVAYGLHNWRKGNKVAQQIVSLQVQPNVISSHQMKTNSEVTSRPKTGDQIKQESIVNQSSHVFGFDKHQSVDRISRVGFPLFFLIFIIIYWSVYSTNDELSVVS